MPAICFADLDAVRRALASGAVPPAVGRGPARVGFDAAGRVWLQPAAPLPGDSAAALARLGAAVRGASDADLTDAVGSWLELVPLAPLPPDPAERPSPVLFDLPDAAGLPALVAEARRLGAGDVHVRWPGPVSPRGEHSELSTRVLALIDSPPFHTLLRATDHHPGSPRAYVRQTARVWVEVGWRHPLGDMIEPPAGHIALLRSPRVWEFVDDGPFQSEPEAFPLPAATGPGGLHPPPAELTLPVPLRLVADHSDDPPELWVLHDRPFDRLRALAEQTDDRLLARLSVAVGEADGRRVVVLRARPGRGGPPVLVLDALPCRPFLRLPNLYLPVGHRLRPPLRRDAVRRLLAPDSAAVVWLEPGDGGQFTAHTLPDAAFRPLEQVIDYVRDRDPEPLTPPAADRPFALLPYIARDLVPAAPRRRPNPPAEAPAPALAAEPDAGQPGLWSRIVRWFVPRHAEPPPEPTPARPPAPPEPPPVVADEPPSPVALEERRRGLEDRLLAALNTPDGPDRQALWPDLARLYADLDRPGDAAVCWLNALWEADDPPADWGRGWLRAEARTARGDGTEADLRRWLAGPPSPAAVRAVAACAAAAPAHDPPPELVESLAQVQRLLDDHEGWLPVRAAWLARVGLTRLTGGDVVGLARTRDRLLERLHAHGLSADLDVPAAVRFAGQGAGERVEAVRAWLTRAREPIHRWLAARPTGTGTEGLTTAADPRLQTFGLGTAVGPTRAYADLILAWGLARLGERGACQDLLTQARGVLAPLDAAHNFLLEAFAFRIAQVLEGRAGGPLPAELLARLADLEERERSDRAARERMLLFKAGRLREHSRVLEPDERVSAFGEGWLAPHAAAGDPALAGLRQVADRDELANRLLTAVASAGRDAGRLPGVLAAALDLAPRLGEAVAGRVLERLLGAAGGWSFAGPEERVEAEVAAVERGLFVAAHFDRAAAVRRLVASLDRLLEARRGGDPGESRPVEDALLRLVGQGLRGLRRLGLRAEADRLLDRLGEWVVPGGDVAAERRRRPSAWPLTLRRLLVLAGGWFYVGRDGPAVGVLDEARRLLFSPELGADAQRQQRTELACAYAAALGQAPVRLALGRVEELFGRLHGVSDAYATNTHYSLAKLRLVEAAVLAVVTDDFALGPAVRRWLDDDEYRVRRRIHRDTRALVGAGE